MDGKAPAPLSPPQGLTNSGSFQIRAPPTNDPDEESGKEASSVGSEEGFLTQEEEEFDTASERQLEEFSSGSFEEGKFVGFLGTVRPVAQLSVDDDDDSGYGGEEDVTVDGSDGGAESESMDDEALEETGLENGVLGEHCEEPSMAEEVSVFYDSVEQLLPNSNEDNAQSGEVMVEIPVPEFDFNKKEVVESEIETATLSPISSETRPQDVVEQFAEVVKEDTVEQVAEVDVGEGLESQYSSGSEFGERVDVSVSKGNALSDKVDKISEPEKLDQESDMGDKVVELKIEAATLPHTPLEMLHQDNVQQVAEVNVNEDLDLESSSYRKFVEKVDAVADSTPVDTVPVSKDEAYDVIDEELDLHHKENSVGLKDVEANVEENLDSESSSSSTSRGKVEFGVNSTSKDEDLDAKKEANVVDLKDVSVGDEEAAVLLNQKLEQGATSSDQVTGVGSNSLERQTQDIIEHEYSIVKNLSSEVSDLDVKHVNELEVGKRETINNGEKNLDEVIPTVEEKRHSGLLEKDVNAVEESVLILKEVDCVVVEDANAKKPSVGDLINQKKVEGVDSPLNEDDRMGVPDVTVRIIKELERVSVKSQIPYRKKHAEIVLESDEEGDNEEKGDGKQLFDSAALDALLKAASRAGADANASTSSGNGNNRFLSTARPAGLGLSASSLKPTYRISQANIVTNSDLDVVGEEDDSSMSKEEKKLQEKEQAIRVKFLRLVRRLGLSVEDQSAAHVLYRLSLVEGIRNRTHGNQAFKLRSAKTTALQLEAEGKDNLKFSFNFLVIGKDGRGKSATINSIFNNSEGKIATAVGAFEPTTPCVKEITGVVDGVKVRVIDTPGLKSSSLEQSWNQKILLAIRKFVKNCPPDVVLYVDRLDSESPLLNDALLLKTISRFLGSSIWHNTIVTLTHAANPPPDGANGYPMNYGIFVSQRSQLFQQAIREAAGDFRLLTPIAIVENHPSCRVNVKGEKVLPNGQVWRPQLLMMCYSSKIISEANALLKHQDTSGKTLFGFRYRALPTSYLLPIFLQSRSHPKLATDEGARMEDLDIDLADLSDSELDGEDEYYQLPSFKPLRKAEIEKLSKEQKKEYFYELDYRVKLLGKKQWKEELQRLKQMKKRNDDESSTQYGGNVDDGDDYDQDYEGPAAVEVPVLDLALPPSFDSDNPSYRYRSLPPSRRILVRPVHDPSKWDHDCGYTGVNVETNHAIASRFPSAITVQVTKDKKDFNFRLDSSISAKLGEIGSSLAALDVQSVGKQFAYTLTTEAKCKTLKRNKTAAGVSMVVFGENVAGGLKIEDQISIGKRVSLVGTAGAMRSGGDTGYGANFEIRLRDKEFPVGQDQSSLGLSVMRTHGDLTLGTNLNSQFSIGRSSKMSVGFGLNNKKSGQITVRTSSSEQLQIALVGLIPIVASIFRTLFPDSPHFKD